MSADVGTWPDQFLTVGMSLALSECMNRSAALCETQIGVTVRQSEDGFAIVKVPVSGVDLEAVERALIVFACETTGGNRSRAAHFLGLTRSALLYRMHKHQVVTSSARPGPRRPENGG